MHDPLAVAFDIRRPWPKRERSHDAKPDQPRWKARYQWATWRKPWTGWMAFWTIAGYGFYFPSVITVWHREPDGKDALTVCRTRSQRPDGTWRYTKGWVWHVHHWKIQVSPLQDLRRRLLTKCEECGRKGRPNVSHQWDAKRGPWWRGERGLYHSQCSSLISLKRTRTTDEEIIRSLVTEVRVRSDEDLEQTIERLTGHRHPTLEFVHRYRLQGILKARDGSVQPG